MGFFIILVLLQGIARTAVQRQQLIKRMEPLAEENVKLKEVMKMMEKTSRGLSMKGILPNQTRRTWNTKRAPYPSR